jgi:hypothetical protein
MHFGGSSGVPGTGTGWPSYYIEDHVGVAQAMQAQVVSLVTEGVFERFPDLRVTLMEGGFAWLPPLMWRLDRAWEKLPEEVPFLQRPPSEYIRQHIRLTTQPMEEPPKAAYFTQLLEQLGAVHMLMFATDYPHWDFDDPVHAFPTKLPAVLERKVMRDNALAWYQLPAR